MLICYSVRILYTVGHKRIFMVSSTWICALLFFLRVFYFESALFRFHVLLIWELTLLFYSTIKLSKIFIICLLLSFGSWRLYLRNSFFKYSFIFFQRNYFSILFICWIWMFKIFPRRPKKTWLSLNSRGWTIDIIKIGVRHFGLSFGT